MQELGLADRYVIGSVGRFSPEKNHAFMLEILKSARRLRPDAALLLIGGGQLLEPIREDYKRRHRK